MAENVVDRNETPEAIRAAYKSQSGSLSAEKERNKPLKPVSGDLSLRGSGIFAQKVNSLSSHLVLLRRHVSQQAWGKGRALLEALGLSRAQIAKCYGMHPRNEEEAVQHGLQVWLGGGANTTWEALLKAMETAEIDVQQREGLKEELRSNTASSDSFTNSLYMAILEGEVPAGTTRDKAARKPTPEANDRRVHTSTQLPQRQLKIDEMYLQVQERSIMQPSIVHTLEEHIQDSVESAKFTEGSQMYMACERYSESYKSWALGYEIILCSVLQLCYETCGVVLANTVAREAVRAYKDGRLFDPEVVAMLQNSLAEEDHAVLEDVASCLVVKRFSIQAQAQQSNSRKYMAVYSLITAYLDITPTQDYIASAKRDILADEALKVVTVHSCVEAFVDKVLPLCWQLVTMYVPPIMTCEQKVKVNGALHDLNHMSSGADTVQSYLFPVVWYGGDVHRKARVLAENFK